MSERNYCRWWEPHKWSKWADKQWSKLARCGWVTSTSSAPEEVGIECLQERRCTRCGHVQLRAERSRL